MNDAALRNETARAAILKNIRVANGAPSTAAAAQAGWSSIQRQFQRTARRERADVLNLLVDRLEHYDAQVVRTSRDDLRETIARMLAARGVQRIVVPAGLPSELFPEGIAFVEDHGLTATELDGFDGVLTESTCAIAETGTVVLQNVAGQGRRAISLVPDYHLCIVNRDDVVETVPEAMAKLQQTSALATTFVSGPSATADIEMTRIKGVHGPRTLNVVLVEGDAMSAKSHVDSSLSK